MRMTFGRGFDSRHLHQFKALISQGFLFIIFYCLLMLHDILLF